MQIPILWLVTSAAFAGLRLDPQHPPTPISAVADRYDIGGFAFDVLPGVLVHLDPDVAPPQGARWLGGRSWRVPVVDAAAAVGLAQILDRQPGMLAFPDVRIDHVTADFDDPDHPGQWYLEELGMDALYAVTLGDPDLRVAVIDSGIDIAHPDLADAVFAPYDAHDDDDDPSPDPGEFCGSGSGICDEHGTAVSGIVASRANNGVGIVGLCPACTLVPIKLLGETAGTVGADIAAFEHAIAQDVGVINNSWGYTRAIPVPQVLEEVIGRASREPRDGLGALVVFAAGNDDREINDNELQALPDVLCVTATDSYGRYTNYTNHGDAVDIAAPSATVSIAPEGGRTTNFGGTSAAAPVVAGLAAWALSVDPTLSAAELHALLVDSAVPSPLVTADENGHHPYYGYGEVDPAALLAALVPADSGQPTSVDPAAEDPKGGCGCSGLGARPHGALFALLLGLGLRARRRP